MAKKSKRPAKRARKAAKPRDLAAKNARAKGGQTAGADRQSYLVYKLKDVIIT